MTPPATLSDDELVRLARSGQRNAFAVLYHRYVAQVHALVGAGSTDAASTEATTVAVFCDLLRHVSEMDPGRVPETLEHHAIRRIRGHSLRARAPSLTVGGVDRMWREIDRRWPSGDEPRRDVGNIVPITAGALVAVLFLGALGSTSRRGGVPDPHRSFQAAAVPDGVGEDPGLLPGLPGPLVTPADDDTADGVATVTLPSEPASEAPTAEPTVAPGAEPEPSPTEQPDAAPEVTITSPSDGSTLRSDGQDDAGSYATVVVEGVAVDDHDPADALTYGWASSIDGPLAGAPAATVRLYVPDGQLTATHVLTFSVTDTAGNSASRSVTVVVTRV